MLPLKNGRLTFVNFIKNSINPDRLFGEISSFLRQSKEILSYDIVIKNGESDDDFKECVLGLIDDNLNFHSF